LVAVFCVNVYRAVTQSITTDEAFTYDRFVSKPSAGLVERFDANNHVLNSLLSKASVGLFGLKEWTLRLPSILGGALYLFAAYRICFLLFGGGAWSFLATALLTTNPLLLDHLSAARGYGLALAFLLLAAYELVRAAEAKPLRSLYAAGIYCGLSIAANMTSLFPVTALTLAFIAVTAAGGRLQVKQLWDQFIVPVSLVSFFFLALPLSNLEPGKFYFGAQHLVDSIRNLAQLSFEYDPIRTDWIPVIGYALHYVSGLALPFLSILLCGSIVYGMIGLARVHRERPSETGPDLTGCFFALTFSTAVMLIVAAHWLLATPYPLMRTALYFVPLVVLAVFSMAYRYREIRPVAYSVAAVGVVCLMAFLFQVNVSYYAEWRFDAGTKRIVKFIRAHTDPGKRLVVRTSWVLEPSLNFYRLRYRLNWQPVDRSGLEKPGDIVIVTQENQASIAHLGLQVIYKDAVSGTVVALPNGAGNSPPTGRRL
jgi:4-amino-4-deoxy-L-arabinose transferase-like glycosyltransferase